MGRSRTHLSELLCFDLYAASRAVTSAYRPLLDDLGLTYPQYLVLVVLWDEGPRPVKGLADRLHLDYGTLTPLLRRMETGGLLTRRRRPEDERSVEVALTRAGAALEPRVRNLQKAIHAAVGITIEEAVDLQDVLRRITLSATAATSGAARSR